MSLSLALFMNKRLPWPLIAFESVPSWKICRSPPAPNFNVPTLLLGLASGKIILLNSKNCSVNHKLYIAEAADATAVILISENESYSVRYHKINYEIDENTYQHYPYYKSRIPALLIDI